MSTIHVKGKSGPVERHSNLLDQIGKVWNNMVGGKQAAPSRAPGTAQAPRSRPSPSVAKTAQNTAPQTAPQTAPTAKKQSVQTSAGRRDVARSSGSGKVDTATRPPARTAGTQPANQPASTRNTVPGKAPARMPVAAAPGSATGEVYGPAAPSLSAAEKRVKEFTRSYDKEATGKSKLQKAMDASRKVFNEGYGDDMFKNNGKSAAAIADVKAQLKSGKITDAQATVASTKILNNFERERVRVTGAQANNAQIGKGVQSAGRVVTVAGSAIGGTIVAGPLGGIAAATVTGSAYDAATKLDQGSARFSHQFDVSNSVGGVAARLIKGEKVNRGDWARGAAGSGMDAISGAFAGGGMLSAKAAQVALLTTAKQTGAKVTLTAMAKAAALSNVKTTLVQTAATTGYKTLTIFGDRSLSAKEQGQLVRRNIKDTVKQAPLTLAFGAGAAFTGVKVQLPHKVADGVLQYGMDLASNGAQKSLENFMGGKGARLSTEDMASVLTQSAGGTLNNMAQRVPHGPQVQRGGGGNAAPRPSASQSNSTLKGRTSTDQTVELKPVATSPFSSPSIKPASRDSRTTLGGSKAATNADGSLQVPKTDVKADAKTDAVLGRLSTADEARLDRARRLESNPFMPGDGPFDAKGRLREGFSSKDFAEGTSTMRVSQDPPGETPRSKPPAEPNPSSPPVPVINSTLSKKKGLTWLINLRDVPLEHERSQTKNAGAEEMKLMSQLRTLSNEHFERTIFNAPSSFRKNMLSPVIQEFERRGYMFRGDMRSPSEVSAAGGFTIANKSGASDAPMNMHDHLFNFMSTRSLVSERFGRNGSSASAYDVQQPDGSMTVQHRPPSGKRGYTYIVRPAFESDLKLSPRNLEPYDVPSRPEMKGPYDFYANVLPGIEGSNLRLQKSSIGADSNELDLRYIKADQLRQLGDAVLVIESEVRSVRDIPCVQIVGSFLNAEGQYSKASEEKFRIGTFEPFEPRIGANGMKYSRGGEIVRSQSTPAPASNQSVDKLPQK